MICYDMLRSVLAQHQNYLKTPSFVVRRDVQMDDASKPKAPIAPVQSEGNAQDKAPPTPFVQRTVAEKKKFSVLAKKSSVRLCSRVCERVSLCVCLGCMFA